MSKQVLTNAKIYIGEYDYSGQLNAVALNYGADAVDVTAFGDTTKTHTGGLFNAAFNVEGFWDSTYDAEIFSNIGVADVPATFSHAGATDGDAGYITKVIKGEYSPGGSVGQAFAFSVGGKINKLIRGTVMHNNTRTSSGSGTARQLGAVSATQKVYAALHVIAASGSTPTLDVTIESDDNAGMTSATNRITFTQATAITSEWKELSGAVTDDYWQVNYTIGGGSPSFQFIVTIGIF